MARVDETWDEGSPEALRHEMVHRSLHGQPEQTCIEKYVGHGSLVGTCVLAAQSHKNVCVRSLGSP